MNVKLTTNIRKQNYSFVIIILIFALFFSIDSFSSTVKTLEDMEKQSISQMEVVAENPELILYLNRNTTEIAIKVKKNNSYWFSNPIDRKLKSSREYQELSYQFSLRHDLTDGNRRHAKIKDNYRYSIQYDQFDIVDIKDGVRIEYQIVEEWRASDYVPRLISQNRFQDLIINNINRQEDIKMIEEQYHFIELVKLNDDDRIDVPGFDKERVFKDYTIKLYDENFLKMKKDYKIKKNKLIELKKGEENIFKKDIEDLQKDIGQLKNRMDTIQRNLVWHFLEVLKENRADIYRIEEIKFEDIEKFVETPSYLIKSIPRFTFQDVAEIIIETGYTPIELREDHFSFNIDPTIANLEIFNVPIEYYLDQDSLMVRVPTNEIIYPSDVKNLAGEQVSYPLYAIRILDNFGAANVNQTGYMFVPDGSGALIHLNNERYSARPYNKLIYGLDYSQDTSRWRWRDINPPLDFSKPVNLPVFGMKVEENAFVAIIEKGDSLANINADIARTHLTYNRISPQFNINYSERIWMHGRANIRFYQPEIYQDDILIRYAFLSGNDANYSGMARRYQEFLIKEKGLERLEDTEYIPFFLELIAAIDTQEPILGLPRTVVKPLTTMGEARKIIEKMTEKGIKNINLKYRGLLEGGIKHVYPENLKLEKSIGTKEELIGLKNLLIQYKGRLYPEIGFLNIYNEGNGFSSKNDAARYITLNQLAKPEQLKGRFILSPLRLSNLLDSFLDNYLEYNIEGLALSFIGQQINSDYRREKEFFVDREDAKKIIKTEMAKLKGNNIKLMVENGQAPILPYVENILNIPLNSSNYNIINQTIPFYQMAVHGFINYAGGPFNLIQDNINILKAIEYSALPYYSFIYNKSSIIKFTDYDHLFSNHYNDWIDLAKENYIIFNELFSDLKNQRIINHKEIKNNVFKTTYENYLAIVVNYNKKSVEINGFKIPGEDFKKIEVNR